MKGSSLGLRLSDEIRATSIDRRRVAEPDRKELLESVAGRFANGKWRLVHGRMEFGPRALGERSILATLERQLRDAESQDQVPRKLRHSRRVARARGDYFELERESPYMLMVETVKSERRHQPTEDRRIFGERQLNLPRSDIPAVRTWIMRRGSRLVDRADNWSIRSAQGFARQKGEG